LDFGAAYFFVNVKAIAGKRAPTGDRPCSGRYVLSEVAAESEIASQHSAISTKEVPYSISEYEPLF
jgi:hypothetical protein